jgi:hypothetical protein
LKQAAVCRAVQERPRVIPGPDDVVRLELEYVGLLSSEAHLMTSLIELSIALNHRVVPVGCLVIRAAWRVECTGINFRERAGHPGEGVGASDFFVAR